MVKFHEFAEYEIIFVTYLFVRATLLFTYRRWGLKVLYLAGYFLHLFAAVVLGDLNKSTREID